MHSADLISLPWITNTTSSILHVLSVLQSSARKIAITSMKGGFTATITILPSLPSGVMVVKQPSSNSLLKYSAMVKINTGIQNVI